MSSLLLLSGAGRCEVRNHSSHHAVMGEQQPKREGDVPEPRTDGGETLTSLSCIIHRLWKITLGFGTCNQNHPKTQMCVQAHTHATD